MAQKWLHKLFNPGPRGKLRWAVFGLLIVFVLAVFFNVIGFANPGADYVNSALKQVPAISGLKIWPAVETNPVDNSKVLVWKNLAEIDFNTYGMPFRLGLDLLGGTHLVYQADLSQVDPMEHAQAVEGVRDVIERRVNVLGVSEPLVQTNKVDNDWRVIIELAGVYDVNQAIEMIGETPLLEFKLDTGRTTQLDPEQQAQLDQANAEVKQLAQEVLERIVNGEDIASLAAEYSDDPGSKENGGLYQGVTQGMFVPAFDEVIFNQLQAGELNPDLVETQFGYHIIKKEAENEVDGQRQVDVRHILLAAKTPADFGWSVEPEWENTGLTGQHLKKATVYFQQQANIPQVQLEFNNEGSDLFADITRNNSGKMLGIFLDGYPISLPRINEPILSGEAVITGDFSPQEAKLLAQRLNAGALPVPINLISQTTVGASLGAASVEKSLVSGIWGLILVAIFMIIIYRLPGIMSVLALALYTALVLLVFKLGGVTLTLAGIAGFILSIGMAVDANVLIFERLKEELKIGQDLTTAVEQGFNRAWSSIRDSNISSLITCGILFWFGSSIIKGFALTLGLGILVSMFSAIVVTKQFLRLIAKWPVSKFLWLYGLNKK